MVRWLFFFVHGPWVATAASVFSTATDEEAAKQIAASVDLIGLSSADFGFLIKEKHWLSAAHVVLGRVQETKLDFSAPVRSAVSSVRKELDDLIRSLDKKYGEASQVSPAFQWAQNSSHVFIQVKFAQRWNAPGALELENSSVTVSDCCLSFKGHGEHSMIKKEYKLFLQFLDPVSEPHSSWHFAAAGRLAVTVAKVRARKWERLLRSENVQPENMGIWRDMQEKWKDELSSFESDKGNIKKKGSDDEDEDSDDDVKNLCEPGHFVGSRVRELCPESFIGEGKDTIWTVLFYTNDAGNKKSQILKTVWRTVGEIVPSHNRMASVGSLDCSRYSAFCTTQSLLKKDLPVILRYEPGVDTGKQYEGSLMLEDLASWAAAETKKETVKPKRRRKAKKEL
jgi:hypothetical protein